MLAGVVPDERIEIAQRILSGPWRHAEGALAACARGAWPAFARSIAPARPLLAGRFDHARCLALAERAPDDPVEATIKLVPLWACSTEDAPSSEWVAVHGVGEEGRPLVIQEIGPFLDDASPRADALWECRVRRWTAATVVESRAYAPGIELLLRAGPFAVLALDLVLVLDVRERATTPLPRPSDEVPMFATWVRPRVEVPAALGEAIAALSFTASDDDPSD
jgi:hypothetical protein